MRDSIGEWMAFVSHRWPFITPAALGDPDVLTVAWWSYYVRAAKAYVEAQDKAAADANMSKGASRRG